MKNLIILFIFGLVPAGCADFSDMPVTPGEPVEAVRATQSQPTGVYPAGPDRRLLSYEQVLTSARFAGIRPGIDTMESVLARFGRPAEKLRLAHPPYDVWAYRHKEQNVWDSMMYVRFDTNGVARKVVNGPDPEREERWH